MATQPTTTGSGEDAKEPDGGAPVVRPRRRRWLVRLIGYPILIYAGVAIFFFAFQTKMIFPGAETQGSPGAVVQAPPGAELVVLTTTRGDHVSALFGKALAPNGSPVADASTCPTLLYFYGNAMCLNDASEQFEKFRRLGFNVMIPDYVGYGMSEGKPGETGCRETAESALAYLRSRQDIDQTRIVVAGWSLGGAVAIDLASRHPVAGVATFCTFTRMADMARKVVPFLPVSVLLQHRFDNLSKIPQVGCPVLIGHGRRDSIIPYAMADRLAEASKGPVTRVTVVGADHNDFFLVGGESVRTALQRFIDDLPRRP